MRYFISLTSKDLYSKEFLDELNELLNKFRNKSAHIEIISRNKAVDFKFVVRKVLARILTYV